MVIKLYDMEYIEVEVIFQYISASNKLYILNIGNVTC